MATSTSPSNDKNILFTTFALTAAYADPGNTTLAQEYRSCGGLSIDVKYTRNAGSASAYLELQVEFSANGSDWAPYTTWADSGSGVYLPTTVTFKMLASQNRIIVIDEVREGYYRIKLQETAVTSTNFGTATVTAFVHSL